MKKVCRTCGGTGQISFFKGESRFLLSLEECVDCLGLGYNLDFLEEEQEENEKPDTLSNERGRKL